MCVREEEEEKKRKEERRAGAGEGLASLVTLSRIAYSLLISPSSLRRVDAGIW